MTMQVLHGLFRERGKLPQGLHDVSGEAGKGLQVLHGLCAEAVKAMQDLRPPRGLAENAVQHRIGRLKIPLNHRQPLC